MILRGGIGASERHQATGKRRRWQRRREASDVGDRTGELEKVT